MGGLVRVAAKGLAGAFSGVCILREIEKVASGEWLGESGAGPSARPEASGLAQGQHPGRMLRSRLRVPSMRHLIDDTLLVIRSQGKRTHLGWEKQRKELSVARGRSVSKWHSLSGCALLPCSATATRDTQPERLCHWPQPSPGTDRDRKPHLSRPCRERWGTRPTALNLPVWNPQQYPHRFVEVFVLVWFSFLHNVSPPVE